MWPQLLLSVLSPRWVAAGHLQGCSSSSLLLTAPFWPRWSSCSSGRWWRTRRRPTAAAAAAHWSPRPTRRSTSRCTGSSRTSAAPTSGPSSERTSRSPSEPPPPLVAAVWVAPGRFGPITAPNSPFFWRVGSCSLLFSVRSLCKHRGKNCHEKLSWMPSGGAGGSSLLTKAFVPDVTVPVSLQLADLELTALTTCPSHLPPGPCAV